MEGVLWGVLKPEINFWQRDAGSIITRGGNWFFRNLPMGLFKSYLSVFTMSRNIWDTQKILEFFSCLGFQIGIFIWNYFFLGPKMMFSEFSSFSIFVLSIHFSLYEYRGGEIESLFASKIHFYQFWHLCIHFFSSIFRYKLAGTIHFIN